MALDIALLQLNLTVGDITGNAARILAARERAKGADLVVTSELALVGYPPEDLILKPAFIDAAMTAASGMAAATKDGGPAILLGLPWREKGCVHNAVALLEKGEIQALRFKRDLPNYGVFDEKRVFAPGGRQDPVLFKGFKLGVMVCEDMWTPAVTRDLAEAGADVLLVVNGSPYETLKEGVRRRLAAERAREAGLPLAYVNQVGGQDELVFDGASFVVGSSGALSVRLLAWKEDVARTLWRRRDGRVSCDLGKKAPEEEGLAADYAAMTLGLKDYVAKNRFPGVLIGMSGGIDSALTAAVAVDALGSEKVRLVMMPSRYMSQASLDDAAECARRLGARIDTVGIEPAVEAFGGMLAGLFEGKEQDATEENIQARIRGVVLMAISNKFGPMLVTTGNKSELSVGYATLYGDMSGGYSVLKDVYKTKVYALSRWRNGARLDFALGPEGDVIPETILAKAPTAELRANQTDQDSLPPYDVLDAILERLVEEEKSLAEIVAEGFDLATAARVAHMLSVAEYKRRQAPPGVKITRRNFGRDRRYPITNAFRDPAKGR